jgi:hypothetical protein
MVVLEERYKKLYSLQQSTSLTTGAFFILHVLGLLAGESPGQVRAKMLDSMINN